MATWTVVLLSVLGTLAVSFVAMNLMSGERRIQEQLERLYDTDDPQFRRSMSVLLGPPMLEGNHVRELVNGDQIFPAMLEAMRGAQRSLTFETFIYWSGQIGDQFAEVLSERARAGVKVHVLLDWVGSFKMEDRYLEQMKEAGVEVERYHKPHWSHLARLNQRTHRKVLVVDGRIGFTGGVGIADEWQGHAQDEHHWRDTHFCVKGPVVAQMQAVFTDNWIKATGRVLHGEAYFPALYPNGDQPAQMFSSSPTGGSESMHLMYLMSITAARHTIHLSSSYFVPDHLAVQALVDARKRGVRVRIITPGRFIDTATVRRASRARWGPLLEAGVEIAEFQPTMFHCKVLVVDGLLVSVGSTNFDNRSFKLNDEANLNVMDAAFAQRLIEVFERDWQRARPVTLQAWRHRPAREKLIEHAAALMRAQL
ncbi:phospholipase D-like domain-containing protein [Azohydromonas caseinilytica]|uniref:Cardiolipin synthase B n=1 Tax=Azohydromonas caseinilytica TaxID=2728836 RepID=A0A848FDP1_9BURK|nr:phospholipase D-like domain-containing protein [Azohydromonas caseinilytica]NML17422.1 cardiolipin synthase B [Azohydromonas caseinilytica]